MCCNKVSFTSKITFPYSLCARSLPVFMFEPFDELSDVILLSLQWWRLADRRWQGASSTGENRKHRMRGNRMKCLLQTAANTAWYPTLSCQQNLTLLSKRRDDFQCVMVSHRVRLKESFHRKWCCFSFTYLLSCQDIYLLEMFPELTIKKTTINPSDSSVSGELELRRQHHDRHITIINTPLTHLLYF